MAPFGQDGEVGFAWITLSFCFPGTEQRSEEEINSVGSALTMKRADCFSSDGDRTFQLVVQLASSFIDTNDFGWLAHATC